MLKDKIADIMALNIGDDNYGEIADKIISEFLAVMPEEPRQISMHGDRHFGWEFFKIELLRNISQT